MKNVKISVLIIILVVIGFIAWFNITQRIDITTTAQPLKIGINPWIGHGLYYVAKDGGFFERERVDIELVNFEDGAIGKQLISSGKIDAISLTPETVVILADAGVKIKAVAMTDTSEGADGVIVSPEIQTIEDLRSKKVALEVGSPSHLFLSYLLNQKGLTTDDLVVVNSAAPDAGAAFVAGKVDAAVTWEPWLSKANERVGGHLLVDSRTAPILPTLPIFRMEAIENRPQNIRAILRALFATKDWIATHQDEAIKIIAKNFNITDQEVLEQLPTFRWFSYQENISGFTTGPYSAKNLIQEAGDLWLKLGLIETPIHADELLDTSLLKDLYL